VNGKTLVIGDIHGRLAALNEVLIASEFNNFEDRLIVLGDVCDGGSQTRGVIDRLLQITNRVDILGNHEVWFRAWAEWKPGDNFAPYIRIRQLWEPQGGIWTEKSYDNDPRYVPQSHLKFLRNMVPYYIDEENRVFVHGGFNPKVPIEKQKPYDLTWDRTLIKYARYHPIRKYNHVFVGHTSTQIFKENHCPVAYPKTYHNLTMCDCGGGWMGRLALVNVENPAEYWLSRYQVPNYEPGEADENGALTEDDYVAWDCRMKD
jgi:serine/threonine protein phosphatase 1